MGRKDRIKLDKKNRETKNQIKDKKKLDNLQNDLFNNPMAQSAIAALSEEDKKRYQFIGEQLYGNINYEENKVKNIQNDPVENMVEAIACIETQLQSGMHPSMLEDNEKAILNDVYGENWYLDWGYIKEDLDSIVTLQPTLKQKLT